MIEPITAAHFAKGLVSPKTHIKTLSFVLIIGFWAFIGLLVWKVFFKKPEATTEQKAETIVNHNYTIEPRQAFFGCANFRIQKESSPNSAKSKGEAAKTAVKPLK